MQKFMINVRITQKKKKNNNKKRVAEKDSRI